MQVDVVPSELTSVASVGAGADKQRLMSPPPSFGQTRKILAAAPSRLAPAPPSTFERFEFAAAANSKYSLDEWHEACARLAACDEFRFCWLNASRNVAQLDATALLGGGSGGGATSSGNDGGSAGDNRAIHSPSLIVTLGFCGGAGATRISMRVNAAACALDVALLQRAAAASRSASGASSLDLDGLVRLVVQSARTSNVGEQQPIKTVAPPPSDDTNAECNTSALAARIAPLDDYALFDGTNDEMSRSAQSENQGDAAADDDDDFEHVRSGRFDQPSDVGVSASAAHRQPSFHAPIVGAESRFSSAVCVR